ncbi:MAG TPA: hypothetical protein VM098_06810 [Phycisphaerae bacterium]|nr:hypothetical protein [Phycisphaerae bacterium]
MRAAAIHVAVLAVLCGGAAAGQPIPITDPTDKQIVEAFLKRAAWVPTYITPERCKKTAAEQVTNYTWQLLPFSDLTLTAYQLSGDANYLEMFTRVFEAMRSALTKGPKGYLGWFGKTLPLMQDPNDPDKKVPELLVGFRAAAVVCRFIELTDGDPALKAKYAKRRAEYLDLLEKHLIAKWDARGCWVDLGAGGAVYRGQAGMSPTRSRLTKPHNMHSIITRGLLALYRVTGRDEYMRRAVKLGTRFRRCLTLKDGHYEWNYWDPAGAWDVHPDDAGKWKHWIGPEHSGHYYALSLTQAVLLYQHGVVFDKADIDRFLKTQTAVAWNGDLTEPKWARVDGSTDARYMQGQYICPALAPFEPKVHEFLYAGARQAERLANREHSWQGGPVADEWLRGKYIDSPLAAGGKQVHLEVGRRFSAKAGNRKLLESLAFEVAGAGYAAPMAPADMKPIPPEPK